MEDGAKEDTVQTKEPKFLGKAGWLKKATGRFLGNYKERFIHVEKTEIVVYENEDLKTCFERQDLENYDRCIELKGHFRKNRLVLIKSPKVVNKVHDIKFLAQNPEDKDAWMKAFTECINRAKNKILDTVKVDEGNNLDHVTRTRPKANRNRRPPTRIHMKEVASVSSDGILRLDLDVPDAIMSNGTHHDNTATEIPKEVIKPPMPPSTTPKATQEEETSDISTDKEPPAEKKILKPPMPPSKDNKPLTTPEEEPTQEESSEKVLMPPMPPSKEAKPSVPPAEEPAKEASPDNDLEKSPEAGTSPSQPESSSSSNDNLTEASRSSPEPRPPTVPSKDKKPPPSAIEPSEEVEESEELGGTSVEDNKKGSEDKKENDKAVDIRLKENSVSESETEMELSSSIVSKDALTGVKEECLVTDSAESTTTAAAADPKVCEPSTEECATSNAAEKSCQLTPAVLTPELTKKSPGPPIVKKKPVKHPPPKAVVPADLCEPKAQPVEETKMAATVPRETNSTVASPQTASDDSVSSPHAEEEIKLPAEPKSDLPTVFLSLNDAPSLSTPPSCLHAEKREREEEKSVDSGQHSDDDSEVSESGDTGDTGDKRGLKAGLDALDVSEDDIETPKVGSKLHSTFIQVHISHAASRPPVPLKPTAKNRSASVGDLLAESSDIGTRKGPIGDMASGKGTTSPGNDATDLEGKVALEIEKTKELLSRVSQSQGEGTPEELLTKAMEKLKKADEFLSEAKSLKESKRVQSPSKRTSW